MAVTIQKARQLFNLVNSKICCPALAASPCIPFLYPDDGCWGRAHEMCRLILAQGVTPKKVWIYGSLNTPTINHPSCHVLWGWHVAPTLDVTIGGGTQVYVIDPSLFNEPVMQATWKKAQGDPNAVLKASAASIFYRNYSGTYTETDANYAKTQQVLNTYRNKLKLRATGSDGPPPYIACLVKPPGTQWIGTIGPNQTQHWFTYNWPPAWHVVWNIMPLTPCPGGPQLTFTVQVERASASACTHWITVKNLTPAAVRFEGRYDILKK